MICELYGCGSEGTEFGFGTLCANCQEQISEPIREQIARELEERCHCGKVPIICSWCEAAAIARGK